MLMGTACGPVPSYADPIFGTWKLDRGRSTFAGHTQPKSLMVRIEPHAKGEVVKVDRTEVNGRATRSFIRSTDPSRPANTASSAVTNSV
jgi:hypothetical protein